MKLANEISDNVKCVKDALNLIELDIEKPDVRGWILDALTHQERLELAKGMFLSVRLLFSSMNMSPSPLAIHELLASTKEMKSAQKKSNEVIVTTLIRLLQAMDNDGGSFYLQLYNLKEPTQVIVKLIHVFKQFSFLFYENELKQDSLKVQTQLKTYVDQIGIETEQRDKERASLVELMRKENEFSEKALQVMEVLAPYFVSEFTEDGEKVYVLKEESVYAAEVVAAVRVPNQVELLKAVCIISCVFLSMYLTVGSVTPIVDERRAQLLAETNLDEDGEDDVFIQHLALNLMDSIVKLDEDDFYQQAAAIDDIYGVIMSLNTSLYRTAYNGLNRTTKDIAYSLRQLLK